MALEVERLDHLVLTVKHINRTASFYCTILGMKKIVFGKGRVSLVFGYQKINLHELGTEFKPKAHYVQAGSFIINTPIEQVTQTLLKHNVPIIAGPVKRTGACRPIMSVYFKALMAI